MLAGVTECTKRLEGVSVCLWIYPGATWQRCTFTRGSSGVRNERTSRVIGAGQLLARSRSDGFIGRKLLDTLYDWLFRANVETQSFFFELIIAVPLRFLRPSSKLSCFASLQTLHAPFISVEYSTFFTRLCHRAIFDTCQQFFGRPCGVENVSQSFRQSRRRSLILRAPHQLWTAPMPTNHRRRPPPR